MKSGYSASDYKALEARINTYAALAVERLKLLQAVEAKVASLQLELADERGAYNSLKEMFDAMIDCGDCQSVAKIKARAEAAEARVKVLEFAAWHLVFLHTCEQEGLNMPTPKEWMEAVDALSKALAAKEKP